MWGKKHLYLRNRNNFQNQRNNQEIIFKMKDKIVRIKEIIITAGGENVAPTNIEEEIKTELPEVQNNATTIEKKKIKL